MNVQITGVESTVFGINELPRKIAKRVLRKSVRAGGNVFLKAARANAPRRNGSFKRSLILKEKQYQATAVNIIGQARLRGDREAARKAKALAKRKSTGGISGRGDVVPTHFIENPIQSHRIIVKNAKVLAFTAPNGVVFMGRAVTHPGTRGQFFLRKAAQASGGTATNAVTSRLAVETTKEAAALGFTV